MVVKCIKILNPVTSEEEAENAAVKIGSQYEVLEISVYPQKRVSFRIESEGDRAPVLFDSRMFVTVDSRIPSRWSILVREDGYIKLAPASWLRPGFWESYFDREPEAVELYNEELALLKEVGDGSERGE